MAATHPNLPEASKPVVSVDTSTVASAPPRPVDPPGQGSGHELYPGTPDPKGTKPAAENAADAGDSSDPSTGVGVDGELAVWEARYSKRNFIGRIGVRILLTIGAAALAYYTWELGHETIGLVTWIAIAAVGIFWLSLIFRMIQAYYSHYYRLTNRRLFVSTGVVRRRRDMMELLRVKDVFTRQQSLMDRWLGLGTVVVVPTEKELPTFYLAGVDNPKEVMDLIWHHARTERDLRSVKVDSV